MTDEQISGPNSTDIEDVDEIAPDGDAETTLQSGVVKWNLAEHLTGIILIAASVLILAGAAAGIIGIFQSPTQVGGTQGEVTGTVLESATPWAGVGGAVLLFLALALLWNLAESSTAAVTDVETEFTEDEPTEEERLRDALRHLGRGQTLTSITTMLFCLNVIAAIAAFAGIVIEGGSPSFDLRWEQYIMGAGICVSTLVLLLGGLNVVRYLNAKFASLDISTTADDLGDDTALETISGSPGDELEIVPN